MASGRPLGSPLTGLTGTVESIAFSQDGKTLATGSADGTVRRWNTPYLVNVMPQLRA